MKEIRSDLSVKTNFLFANDPYDILIAGALPWPVKAEGQSPSARGRLYCSYFRCLTQASKLNVRSYVLPAHINSAKVRGIRKTKNFSHPNSPARKDKLSLHQNEIARIIIFMEFGIVIDTSSTPYHATSHLRLHPTCFCEVECYAKLSPHVHWLGSQIAHFAYQLEIENRGTGDAIDPEKITLRVQACDLFYELAFIVLMIWPSVVFRSQVHTTNLFSQEEKRYGIT